MSFCRKNLGSDVYVYRSEGLVCHECSLHGGSGHFVVSEPKDMLKHLRLHEEAGHKVPFYAIEQLMLEAATK